jgi:hypothetical protein
MRMVSWPGPPFGRPRCGVRDLPFPNRAHYLPPCNASSKLTRHVSYADLHNGRHAIDMGDVLIKTDGLGGNGRDSDLVCERLFPDDSCSPFSNRDDRLSMLMDRPEHRIGYHNTHRETEQANSGQRYADETHGSSSGLVAILCGKERTDGGEVPRSQGWGVDNSFMSLRVANQCRIASKGEPRQDRLPCGPPF